MPVVFRATEEEADKAAKSVKGIVCLASVALKGTSAYPILQTDDVTLGCRFI